MSSAVEKTYRGQQIVISAGDAALPGRLRAATRPRPTSAFGSANTGCTASSATSGSGPAAMRDARAAFGRAFGCDPDASRPRSTTRRHSSGRRWLEPLRRLRRAPSRRAEAGRAPRRSICCTTRRSGARARPPSASSTASTMRRRRIGRTKQRMLFEAASPLSLVVSRPVLDILRRDPRLELWFTDERRGVGPGVDLRVRRAHRTARARRRRRGG